ncbi:type VII secretion target [Nocardia alni]|uniref:type VII secretion target n=1 Tax=Nocardia alni TaxID=2815723 RepID=UPI001C228BA8|nr:type VII secretion target [Nocardia alni]
MPDSLDVDLQLLYDLANQHDQVADDTRTWAQPPTEWLASFPDTYGKIAHPVHQALNRYYDARQRAGEALADGHNKTAAALRASAEAFEQADQAGATHIGRAGDQFGGHPGYSGGPSSGPMAPAGHGGGPAAAHTAAPVGIPPGGGPHAGGPSTTSTPEGPLGQIPGGDGGGPDSQGPGGFGVVPPALTGSGTVPSSGFGTSPLGGFGGFGGPGGGPGGGQGPTPLGPEGPIPILVPTPFAAAVHAVRKRENDPAVVNGVTDDDLLIARTLLGAVLATVDSSVAGTAWAVSVMRGPAGVGVFITSNEGRGWLPPAVFLPREVSTPWLWDEVLDPDGTGAGSPWEGVSDPARVLVEFGLAWGPPAGAKLSALASSGPIDAGLRAQLSDVPMQGLVGPSFDVDLRVFTPDTADRLGLTGSKPALEQVAAVPDSAVRSRCIELATDADAQVTRSVAATPDVAAARRLREAILTAVQSGRPVPRTLWDDLRDADDLLAASLLTRRVDVGRVEVGALRLDDEAGALRALAFERRCNELVLALAADDSTRQSLRDAVYAHEQIVGHPQFVAAPVAVSAPEVERVARPAAAGGVDFVRPVTAGPPSGATAGPPNGAIAPPIEQPPTLGVPGIMPETR